MATAAGLLVTLPQMVDLALGSPETGAVNFNLLAAAMQVIIKELNLAEFVVDFRGPDVERMEQLVQTAKSGETIKIHEIIDEEAPAENEDAKHDKIIIVEQRTKQLDSSQTLPQVVVGVSQELFVQMNTDVENLKSRMTELLEIPTNETVIEAVKAQGHDKISPAIDMWHALQISKRLEGAETGMDKLTAMFEDLVAEIAKYEKDLNRTFQEMVDRHLGRVEIPAGANETPSQVQEPELPPPLQPRQSIFERIDSRLEKLESQMARRGGAEGEDGKIPQNVLNEIELLKSRLKPLETDVTSLTKGSKGKSLAEAFKQLEELTSRVQKRDEEGGDKAAALTEAVLEEIQEKFNEQITVINNLDENLSSQIKQIQEQFLNIEKELGTLLEAANTKADSAADAGTFCDVYNKILRQQEEIDALNKVTDRFTEEQEERALAMEALTEQLEILKTRKANREDLEDALADKADTQQVNRKVSSMQFDAAYEDLTRHIEDTVGKLTQQEELWQNTLMELQMTIGGKLDKQDFDPLKDFVNKKIKSLQQRLKALLAMKQDQEAAGTKNKLLKNVNCISCDKDVVMYKENKFTTLPTSVPMPGSKSIKPYITYELDAIRKQQKSLPQGRNMNYLESALHEPKKDKPLASDKTLPAGHLCNRYCGGSHTMTQPQQRVGHIGHFLNQWGPHAVPLDEGTIVGTDGQLYKARETGTSPRAVKDLRRISAEMQTDEPTEKVPRMTTTLDQIRRTSKTKRGSKQVGPSTEGQLEPVKEETADELEKDKKKSAQRRKSSSKDESKKRPSTGSKGQRTSLKRLSQGAHPRDIVAEGKPAEVAAAEKAPVEIAPAEGATGEEAPAEVAPIEIAPGEAATEAPAEGEAPSAEAESEPAPAKEPPE